MVEWVYRFILPPSAYILKTAVPLPTVGTPGTGYHTSIGAGQGRDSKIKDSSGPAQNPRKAQEKAQWQVGPDWERLTSEPGLIPESSVTLTVSLP